MQKLNANQGKKKLPGPTKIKGEWQAYLMPNKSMTPCKEKKKKLENREKVSWHKQK